VSATDEPVVVGAAPDSVSGSVLASALESAGIPAMVRQDGAGAWLYPGTQGGFSPVSILVPASAEADARAILAELNGGVWIRTRRGRSRSRAAVPSIACGPADG
jgi:hypothetical protein